MINPFKYRLLQGIARGKIKMEVATEWSRYAPQVEYQLKLWCDGKVVAIANSPQRRPDTIAICGVYVKTKELYQLKDAMEIAEKRKENRIALNKLMSYLSGSSEDSLTNK